jgi:hypothetical protein
MVSVRSVCRWPRESIPIAGEGRGKNLDRDIATKPGVAREIDLAHTADAEQRAQVIATDSAARHPNWCQVSFELRRSCER